MTELRLILCSASTADFAKALKAQAFPDFDIQTEMWCESGIIFAVTPEGIRKYLVTEAPDGPMFSDIS